MALKDLYEELTESTVRATKDVRTGYWRVEIQGIGALTKDDRFHGTKVDAIKLARANFKKGKLYVLPYSGGTGRYSKADAIGKGYTTIKAAEKARQAADDKAGQPDAHVVRWLLDR